MFQTIGVEFHLGFAIRPDGIPNHYWQQQYKLHNVCLYLNKITTRTYGKPDCQTGCAELRYLGGEEQQL